MRHLKRWLLPLFTLLLVAVGAVMPFAVANMQDAQQAEAEVRSFDSFRLTLRQEADLGQVLGLLTKGNYYIEEDSEAKTARLTRPEVIDAAEEAMTALFKHDLLETQVFESLGSPNVWPQTLVANDESITISTWTVQWDMQDTCYVWLDDATGKAFMISVPRRVYPEHPADPDGTTSEAIYMEMDAWRLFLEDYYGVRIEVTDEEWYDAGMKFVCSFPLGAGEDQEVFQLALYIYFAYDFSTLSPYVS